MNPNCCSVYYKGVIIRKQTVILGKKSKQYQTYPAKKELEHATGIDASKKNYCFKI